MAHVDLGLTGDSAGVAVGWVEGFTKVPRSDNTFELMPQINLDLILEVRPPRGGEIEFEDIRKLFYKLREQGMNLNWISFDSYQSADSIQILRQQGFSNWNVLDGQEFPALRRHQNGIVRRPCEGAETREGAVGDRALGSATRKADALITRPTSARIAPMQSQALCTG